MTPFEYACDNMNINNIKLFLSSNRKLIFKNIINKDEKSAFDLLKKKNINQSKINIFSCRW